MKNRRRRKYIWPELQLRIAVQTLFIAIPILLLNFLLLYSDSLSYQRSLQPPADAAAVGMLGIIFRDFLISLAVAIPFSLGVGILYSFPFCGPIYRMHTFLGDMIKGRWDGRCALRRGDRLQEVKNNLNGAVQLLTGTIRRQHELLGEVRALLEDSGTTVREPEKARSLLERIAANRDEVSPRFGPAETRTPEDAVIVRT